jgi:hypothetical protein
LLQAAMGMDIDAVRRRITFSRASLPLSIDRLVLTNLTVGDARVDLALERHAHDVGVNVVRRDGQLEIIAIK